MLKAPKKLKLSEKTYPKQIVSENNIIGKIQKDPHFSRQNPIKNPIYLKNIEEEKKIPIHNYHHYNNEENEKRLNISEKAHPDELREVL